jgi:hypothetical protein
MIIRYLRGGQQFTVEFDATLREIHTAGAQATTHPVEKGSDIADHVQINQPKLTIEAVVTNAPIKTPASNADGVAGEVRKKDFVVKDSRQITFGVTTVRVPITKTVSAQVLQFDQQFDRVKNVVAVLVDIVENARLVEITNGLRDYEDMVLVNLQAPREATDSTTITFDALHIDFVETETTTAPGTSTKRRNRGNKGAKEAKPETKEYQSVASKLKDWATKQLGIGQ